MDIPNYVETQLVDSKGNLTPVWKNIMMNLISQLQKNYSQEGLFIPQQTTGNITKLENQNSTSSVIYNKSTHKVLVNVNGTYKEIQVV